MKWYLLYLIFWAMLQPIALRAQETVVETKEPKVVVKDSKSSETTVVETKKVEAKKDDEEEGIPTVGKGKITDTIEFLKKAAKKAGLIKKDTEFNSSLIFKDKRRDITAVIKDGYTVLDDIYNDKIKVKNQADYLYDIVALSWALFDRAVKQGQGFTGGTIVFTDPGQKVYKFLLNYAQQMQVRDPKVYVSTKNCFAYHRRSTHFEELTKLKNSKDYQQIGIDMRYSQDGKEFPLLPPMPVIPKAHLLFGRVKTMTTERTMIKWEVHGLCGYKTALKHAYGIFASKKHGISRGEKLPKNIKKEFKEILAALQTKKVPSENVKIFAQELKKAKTAYSNGKYLWNIYLQANRLQEVMKQMKVSDTRLDKFIEQLEKDFDNLTSRRGNEVILN